MALPPGLEGFVLAQQQGRSRDAGNIQNLAGVLSIQGAMENQRQAALLHPLQLTQLQTAVEQAKENARLRGVLMAQLTGGGSPTTGALSSGAPLAFGTGGISTPGGGQANLLTGQTVAPGAAPGAAPGRGSSGILSGVNPAAALMMLSGDAGMGKLGGAIQDANKPIAAREGAPVINPATGEIISYFPKLDTGMLPQFEGGRVTGVSNLPGYVPAMTERTVAQEGEKYVDATIDGRPVRLKNSEYATLYGPPSLEAAQIAERYGIRYNNGPVTGAVPSPATPAAPSPVQPGASPTAQGPSVVDRLPLLGGGPRIPVNPTPAEQAGATATSKERAEGGVKFEQSVLDAGRAAQSNLTDLQIIAPNIEKLPTGPIYPMLVTMKNYLNQLGFSVDPNLGPAQATTAFLNQMALKVRNPAGGAGMPGAMSDADRQFLMQTIPSLGTSPQGNKMLVKILSALEQRKIDEAGIVNKMQAANMNSTQIREALNQYARSNSMAAGLR